MILKDKESTSTGSLQVSAVRAPFKIHQSRKIEMKDEINAWTLVPGKALFVDDKKILSISTELKYDLRGCFGIDLEAELINLLTSEINGSLQENLTMSERFILTQLIQDLRLIR